MALENIGLILVDAPDAEERVICPPPPIWFSVPKAKTQTKPKRVPVEHKWLPPTTTRNQKQIAYFALALVHCLSPPEPMIPTSTITDAEMGAALEKLREHYPLSKLIKWLTRYYPKCTIISSLWCISISIGPEQEIWGLGGSSSASCSSKTDQPPQIPKPISPDHTWLKSTIELLYGCPLEPHRWEYYYTKWQDSLKPIFEQEKHEQGHRRPR